MFAFVQCLLNICRKFEYIISHGSVATCLRCSSYCRMGFVANFIRFPAMQKVWKSVKNWQSYREYKGGNFFWDTVYIQNFHVIQLTDKWTDRSKNTTCLADLITVQKASNCLHNVQGGPKSGLFLEVCNSHICWHRIPFYISKKTSVFYPEQDCCIVYHCI